MGMKSQDHQKPSFSIFQGDGFYFNKILSRKSSATQSSHVYYYFKPGEGMPFEWEMQPGIPKTNDPPPPEEEATIIPRPTPSPMMQSLLLSEQQCMCSSKSHSGLKGWLMKTINKIKEKSKVFQSRKKVQPCRSSSYVKLLSSSSNHSSSSRDHLIGWDPEESPPRCKPWKVSNILVRATRQNLMN